MYRGIVVGYDLDGVLVNDLSYEKFDNGRVDVVKYIDAKELAEPLFIPPQNHFYIITGREIHELEHTQNFVDRWFGTDCTLVLGNTDWRNAAIFKEEQIIRYGITHYFESYPEQVKYLREALRGRCHVFHFAEVIRYAVTTSVSLLNKF